MGFRKKIGDRSCIVCGTTDDNNQDPENGKFYQLDVVTLNLNFWQNSPSNHAYVCKRHRDQIVTMGLGTLTTKIK